MPQRNPIFPFINLMKRLRDKRNETAGKFLSNVKVPRSYNLPGFQGHKPFGIEILNDDMSEKYNPFVIKGLQIGQLLKDTGEATFNTIIGKDEPVWDYEKEGDNIKARDYLFRSSFPMSEEERNRLGKGNTFYRTGKNELRFNPNSSTGAKMQEDIDRQASDWLKWKLEHTMKEQEPEVTYIDESGRSIPQTVYPFSLNNAVLGNFDFEQLGEGEDEKGYYINVGGKNAWDLGLHPNEKILDISNPKKSVINLLRSIADDVIEPQTINYSSKVYVPGVKKQPRYHPTKHEFTPLADETIGESMQKDSDTNHREKINRIIKSMKFKSLQF